MVGLTWIKLNLEMFDNKKIKQIRKMPGGNDMVLFWVMLLTLAGKSNSQGYILFTENIAYTPEMLANECDMELNTVKMALELFSKFNMISMQKESILITSWSEHQNIEGMERAKLLANERVRRHRDNKKKLIEATQEETCSDTTVTLHDTLHETYRNGGETDIKREEIENRDIENIDIEREKEEEISLIDESLEVCKYFEAVSNGKSIMQFMNDIKLLIDMYSKSWVLEAIDITVSKHVYSLPFIKKILRNWVNDGKKRGGNGGSSGENTKSSSSELYDFSKYGGKRN